MTRDEPSMRAETTRRDFLRDAVFGVHAIAAADLLLRGSEEWSETGPPCPKERYTMSGGPGADELRGWRGNDTLVGGAGRDRADGDKGRDRCVAERTDGCER